MDDFKQGYGVSTACRKPYWVDLGDKAKIERTRNKVKRLQGLVSRLEDTVAKLMKHQHLSGKLVEPTSDSTDLDRDIDVTGTGKPEADHYF